MGVQSWGHCFPLAQAAHLCTTERYQYFLGEAMGLADPASVQIKYEAGRETEGRGENESNVRKFQAVLLCLKELVKDGVFPFLLLLQRKKKTPNLF